MKHRTASVPLRMMLSALSDFSARYGHQMNERFVRGGVVSRAVAAVRFLRERFGGELPRNVVTVDVYLYTDDTPRWPNGAPQPATVSRLYVGQDTFRASIASSGA